MIGEWKVRDCSIRTLKIIAAWSTLRNIRSIVALGYHRFLNELLAEKRRHM